MGLGLGLWSRVLGSPEGRGDCSFIWFIYEAICDGYCKLDNDGYPEDTFIHRS